MTNKPRGLPQVLGVFGGQFGSEGKGAIVHHLAPQYKYHVRVGGPQAGHSVLMPDGTVRAYKQIPVGGATPGTTLIIGMAAVVDVDVLLSEIEWDPEQAERLYIDPRATWLTDQDRDTEQMAGLVANLGSTGKGVGAARAARVMRGAPTVGDIPDGVLPPGVTITETDTLLADAIRRGESVLLEGAQGQGLSLFSGGFYPTCTSTECGPAQMWSDLGLPLSLADRMHSLGVYRTFPIRVAGPSGPLTREMSWDDLRARYGDHIPTEYTTVTKKVRRVGAWDRHLAARTARQMDLWGAALTFVDYPYPEAAADESWHQLPRHVRAFVRRRESEIGVPIRLVATGFGSILQVPEQEVAA